MALKRKRKRIFLLEQQILRRTLKRSVEKDECVETKVIELIEIKKRLGLGKTICGKSKKIDQMSVCKHR